jgi:hypothetical protein
MLTYGLIPRAKARVVAAMHQPEFAGLPPKAWHIWGDRIVKEVALSPIGTASGGIAGSCGNRVGQWAGCDEVHRGLIKTVDPGQRRASGPTGPEARFVNQHCETACHQRSASRVPKREV